MLDIIKDLHLTVQNIVAGIAFISQDPDDHETITWEIKNGINQPTVTISYKLNLQENADVLENSLKHGGKLSKLNKDQLKACYQETTNFLKSKVLQPNDNITHLKEKVFPVDEPSAILASPVHNQEQSHITPEVQIKIERCSDDELNEFAHTVEGETRTSENRYFEESFNMICHSDDGIATSSDEVSHGDKFILPSDRERLSELLKLLCKNDKRVIDTISSETLLKFKKDAEKWIENYCCERVVTNKSSVDLHMADLEQNTKETNLVISDKYRDANCSPTHDIKPSISEHSEVDIFTPEIILKTNKCEEADNFTTLKNVRRQPMSNSDDHLHDMRMASYSTTIQETNECRTKLFTCNNCHKSFRLKNDLLVHVRIHTGEKPFPCTYCGKCFRDMRDKRRHERIHTGEKPYACKHCNRRFSRNHHKMNHERTHTGEKPFLCNYCGKGFTQVRSKRMHEKNSCKKRHHYRKGENFQITEIKNQI